MQIFKHVENNLNFHKNVIMHRKKWKDKHKVLLIAFS